MSIDTINLGYFKNPSGGHCGYCDSNKSFSTGFVTPKLSTLVYLQLMDKGWRRCGTYYYKYDLQQCCCLGYTIRADIKLSKQKKQHRKIAQRFMKILNDDKLNQPFKDIPTLLQQFKNEEEKSEQKIHQEQQVKGMEQNQKQEKIQQIQQIPEQKQDKKQQQQQHIQIPKDLQQQLKESIFKLHQLLCQNKQQFIQLFDEYFKIKNFDLSVINEIFDLDIDQNQIKFFKTSNTKKGDYYTNYIMMIYGKNKKQLFQDYPITKFAIQIKSFIDQHFMTDQYKYIQEDTGYLSIFETNHIKQLQIHQNKLEKEIEKRLKLEKTNQEIVKHQHQQIKKENIKLIKRDNFKTNLFYVGNMKISLKQADCTDESFQLYQRYCKSIHDKKKESKDSYNDFLCSKGLKNGIIKSNIDPSQLLFLGCYHMCYYIQDKLVAIGVIDITEKALSSVYFFYDPDFEEYNFGILGALIEIEYIQILNSLFPDFTYYYLGFYIQTTPKMLYKGDFKPAELLCPQTYTWVHLSKELKKEIDKRSKQKPNERVLRLSQNGIPVIQDMVGQIDFGQLQIIMKGQSYLVKNLGFQDNLIPYFRRVKEISGNTLMSNIKFEI